MHGANVTCEIVDIRGVHFLRGSRGIWMQQLSGYASLELFTRLVVEVT
jgi:hypothetical protein